jgi:hypothetical protein
MNDPTSVHERHEAAFAELGYRPSRARICPRVIAGRHCRADVGCICHAYHRVLDHARIWLDEAGDHVLTAEPYHAHGTDLVAFLLDLELLGLRACLSGASPWNPGHTLLITVRRAEEVDR